MMAMSAVYIRGVQTNGNGGGGVEPVGPVSLTRDRAFLLTGLAPAVSSFLSKKPPEAATSEVPIRQRGPVTPVQTTLFFCLLFRAQVKDTTD